MLKWSPLALKWRSAIERKPNMDRTKVRSKKVTFDSIQGNTKQKYLILGHWLAPLQRCFAQMGVSVIKLHPWSVVMKDGTLVSCCILRFGKWYSGFFKCKVIFAVYRLVRLISLVSVTKLINLTMVPKARLWCRFRYKCKEELGFPNSNFAIIKWNDKYLDLCLDLVLSDPTV